MTSFSEHPNIFIDLNSIYFIDSATKTSLFSEHPNIQMN